MNTGASAVTISEAYEMMSAVIMDAFERKKIPQNVCLHGSPGLGKSAIVWALAREVEKVIGKTVKVIDIRLSAMEAADVQGIPYVSETGIVREIDLGGGNTVSCPEKEMFFSTPQWFPRDPDVFYILFLDELLNCGPQVQHAAYRLILDRSIQNGAKLPDNCAVVAAGNLKSDKTGAKPLLPAAANRFGLHLFIDPQRAQDSFMSYAFANEFHPAILGYAAWRGQDIYIAPQDGEPAFPTPRSWEFVNDHLHNTRFSDYQKSIAVASAIGDATGSKLMGFLEYHEKLPNWKDVRSGKITYEVPQGDEGLKYAVGSAMSYELIDAMKIEDYDQANAEVTNLCNVLAQIPKEIKAVTFKGMRGIDKSIVSKFTTFPALRSETNILLKTVRGES